MGDLFDMRKTKMIAGAMLAAALTLTACSNEEEKSKEETSSEHSSEHMHGDSEVPSNLVAAENPTYDIGSKAIINANHMEGMKGAEATVTGAYETIAYTVSYIPVSGKSKDPVDDHKWVIQEEIKDAGDKMLENGEVVIIEADHMKGMKGAEATIESAKKTTVYMIDYTPTTGGEKVTNHKWLVESELK